MWSKNPHTLPKSNYGGAGKRLFLGLMCASGLLLSLFLLVGWLIPYLGLTTIHPSLPLLLGSMTALIILCVAWMCLSVSYHVYTGRSLPGMGRVRGLTIKLMYPLMELLGRAVGVEREKIRLSFVKVNNELVLAACPKVRNEDILVLLPHCIQNSRCAHRLNHCVDHCRRCGLCPVGDLLHQRDLWGFKMVLASGGTVARRIVVESKPRLIVGVACERDLTSGIQDTYPLPVFGLLNQRPHGPCIDTLLDVQALEEVLRFFVPPEMRPHQPPSEVQSKENNYVP